MRLGDFPLFERVGTLHSLGLKITTVHTNSEKIEFTVPGYPGVPLAVTREGFVGHADEQPCTEFSLRRERIAIEAAEALASDAFGVPTWPTIRDGLNTLGWEPLQPVSSFDGIRLTLVKGPPRVVARVLRSRAWLEQPARRRKLPELTRALAQRRLLHLRRILEDIVRGLEYRAPMPVNHYLAEARTGADPDHPPGSATRPWTDVFRRSKTCDLPAPLFYLCGSTRELRLVDGYDGGHRDLDRILDLCGDFGLPASVSGSSSPGNASLYELDSPFLDGGLRVVGGTFLACTPQQGAYVHGFLALRWVLWHLGCRQPRRLSGEGAVPTPDELAWYARSPRLP